MTKKGYICLLIILGIIIYFNALFNGFLWDDEEQVLNNVLVHSIANFPQFFSGSTFNTGGSGSLGGLYYKPLMTTFFSLIYTLFGANSFFFHFFQIGLHILNSIFIFLIFRYFFNSSKKDFTSFVLALFFLIHPINVEAVAYVSDFQEVLFFFFGIFGFWLVVSKRLASVKNYFLLFLLMLFSLLSKESGALFIFITGLYSLLFSKKHLKTILVTLFCSISVYSILRFVIAGIYFNKHGLTPISTLTFFERLLSVPKIVFFYLKTFIYPINLSISQHWVVNSLSISEFYIPLILCLIVFTIFFGFLYYLHFKRSSSFKIYLFFLAWFLTGIFLHLQVVFPLDMTVSERWFYFPIIGLLGMLGVVFFQFKLNIITKKVLLIILVLIIFFLGIRTIIRNSNWKDGLTLYSHDELITPNSFDLENNLGVELFRAGRFNEAEAHFLASTKIAPSWWTNWNNLGVIVERKSKIEEAKIYYQKAIDNGQYYLAYQNLAKIYLYYDTPDMAKSFCEESLKKFPNNASLWTILAISEYKLKDQNKALLAAKNAYLLEPSQQNALIYSRLQQNLSLEDK